MGRGWRQDVFYNFRNKEFCTQYKERRTGGLILIPVSWHKQKGVSNYPHSPVFFEHFLSTYWGQNGVKLKYATKEANFLRRKTAVFPTKTAGLWKTTLIFMHLNSSFSKGFKTAKGAP